MLQQDGDPTHAKATQVIQSYNARRRGSAVALLPNWPGNSPDVSPIENVWAWADSEVAKLGCKKNLDACTAGVWTGKGCPLLPKLGCKTLEEFKDAVDYKFQNVPRSMCENLTASVPKRLKRCVEFEGTKTGY